MVIYKGTKHWVKRKILHVRKIGGRVCRGFCWDEGDVPALRFNEITGKVEEVVNPRGNAYSLRNALRYRRKAKAGRN